MECPSQLPPGIFDFSVPHDSRFMLLIIILAGFLVVGVGAGVFLSLKLHRTVPRGTVQQALFRRFYFAQTLGLLGSLILLLGLLWLGASTSGYPLIPGALPLFDALGCVGGSTQAAYTQLEQVLMVLAGVVLTFLFAYAILLSHSTIRLRKLARVIETP